jgi:hypothetical protein
MTLGKQQLQAELGKVKAKLALVEEEANRIRADRDAAWAHLTTVLWKQRDELQDQIDVLTKLVDLAGIAES